MFLSIFYQFFLLGCTSFGGPAAHLGFFKKHFVDNLNWVSASRYANMISLSQILPGPGSSQVGFAIGLEKGGILGGVAAFLGFTLPSFLIMVLLAMSTEHLSGSALGIISGLKLFAVVVVADAVLTMAKSFCKTTPLKVLAFLTTLSLLVVPALQMQLLVLLTSAAVACVYSFSSIPDNAEKPQGGTVKWGVFLLFLALFVMSLFALPHDLFANYFQAGALVFGGGHVVLPLLQSSVAEMDQETFLTAYAAAQAIPGPMFTIASFLGAVQSTLPLLGAAVATLGIFLPGLLLMWAFNQHWQQLLALPRFASISAALNAAVVGILAAAFYQPIWLSAVASWLDIVAVGCGFIVLKWLKPAIWQLLIAFATFGVIAS
ncbi:chromate efflux transporter [Pseudoalteromonas sp. T1lg65]|uniref:chromate efflux transporter n=1 Tax=Pseudoalteromonas sp. T1lg65 TaxID=2077101 RepID=UPI003F7B028E